MPDPALLTDGAREYIDGFPIFMREDPDAIAVAYAISQEFDRLLTFLLRVQANMIPSMADALTFSIWEELFSIRPDPGEDDAARLAAITARWEISPLPGSGTAWVAAVARFLGPGWDYREHVPGVAVLPSPETVVVRVPFATNSDEFRRAQDFFDVLTPVNVQVLLQSVDGFSLDGSELDVQTL